MDDEKNMIESIMGLWELVKYAIDGFLWTKKRIENKSLYAIDRVNNYINTKDNSGSSTKIKIYGIIKSYPKIKIEGQLDSNEEVKGLAEKISPNLELNEVHAVVPNWDTRAVQLHIKTTLFSSILAMRELGNKPPILSAGAVVVCPEERCLILHKRSEYSATYKGVQHILGGAYKPTIMYTKFDSPGDRKSLEFTMVREVFEESGLIVRSYEEPISVAKECDTGFIQYVKLGVRISTSQLKSLNANTEGSIIQLPFDNLIDELKSEVKWVPTGRAQVLLWLGIGAPGAGFIPRFSGKTAKEAFDEITK